MSAGTLAPRLLQTAAAADGRDAPDGLRLSSVPFVPELRLILAQDPTLLWARLEAAANRRLPPPFWASAWPGGQALARYVLDHPDLVAGRCVLDVATGCGLVALAAAKAGAARVTANDTDPHAISAVAANARVNDVRIAIEAGDMLDRTDRVADVVLAGDVLYAESLAERMLRFLGRQVDQGAHVLVGDPGRGRHPEAPWLKPVAAYDRTDLGPAEDAQIGRTTVLSARRP